MEITKIQRRFLWGGDEDNKKLAWVRWGTICLPKEEGGLGVKNLEVFNVALLTKWRWRILVEENNPIWKEILMERYGVRGRWPDITESRRGWEKKSLWWRDLCLLGEDIGVQQDWFSNLVKIKIGKGNLVRFWKDIWIGMERLEDAFPDIYNWCTSKEATVEEFGQWTDEGWRWSWDWAADLLLHNADLTASVAALQQRLCCVFLSQCMDKWLWLPDALAGFTVKKCYSLLLNFSAGVDDVVQADPSAACKKIWKNDVPSKVQIFVWRVLLKRIATRVALHRRGIIQSQNDLSCVLCFRDEETVDHLFMDCGVAKVIWRSVFAWLGCSIGDPGNIVNHFVEFGHLVKGKRQRGVKHLIWMVVIWKLWLARNNVIFNGEVASIPGIIDGIKDTAWSWFKARRGRNCSATWADWYNCPLGCYSML